MKKTIVLIAYLIGIIMMLTAFESHAQGNTYEIYLKADTNITTWNESVLMDFKTAFEKDLKVQKYNRLAKDFPKMKAYADSAAQGTKKWKAISDSLRNVTKAIIAEKDSLNLTCETQLNTMADYATLQFQDKYKEIKKRKRSEKITKIVGGIGILELIIILIIL